VIARLHRFLSIVLMVVALTIVARTARAAPPEPGEPLIVAVKQAPPFAVKGQDGEWTGTSITLWREIAAELELDYELRETTLDDMLAGVADGRYQVAVAALTVTSEREATVDFTHPFHTTGLAIAASSKLEPHWLGVFATVFSRSFLRLIATLALLQLAVGAVVWALERRANSEQFPSDAVRGVSSGFWWAAVTMATVGYGDKAPKTPLGRFVAMLWMLASLIMLASATAIISASLTIERLDARLRGPDDLHRFEVGVIAQTTGAAFVRDEKMVAHTYTDAEAALTALANQEIDALVWDAPLLRTAIEEHPEYDIELVPGVFQRQDYAIAVGEGSPLREAINRVMPEKVRDLDFDPP
jgi:polar amino acid transport system substrate-binding protein